MKHVNPSGAAVGLPGESVKSVYLKARDADARAAFRQRHRLQYRGRRRNRAGDHEHLCRMRRRPVLCAGRARHLQRRRNLQAQQTYPDHPLRRDFIAAAFRRRRGPRAQYDEGARGRLAGRGPAAADFAARRRGPWFPPRPKTSAAGSRSPPSKRRSSRSATLSPPGTSTSASGRTAS